jgi:23S rRNA (uridine2552-2'-O)-methyltransferase
LRIMSRGNRWEDHYTRRARHDKWLARSVYKLEEIDKRFKIIRHGDRVLDLGCYPGSWSQYCVKRVGPKGEVVGVDLKEPDRLSAPNFRFVKADVLSLDVNRLAKEVGPRDAVISDLAPQTTGVAVADVSRSLDLAGRALIIALATLRQGGHCLCKVFEGEGFGVFRQEFSQHFDRIRMTRPSATRKASREVYLLGLGLLDETAKGDRGLSALRSQEPESSIEKE